MNELKQDAPPVPAAATNAVHEIGRRRLLDRYAADAARAPLLLSLSNADKYCWIRANAVHVLRFKSALRLSR